MKAIGWIAAILILIVAGCDEEKTEPEPVRELELVQAPTTLLANYDSLYTVSVRVSEGFLPDSVSALITRAGDPAEVWVRLYDDGGLDSVSGPDFASARSGDLVAHSGTYTRRINSRLLAIARGTGVFRFSYRAFTQGSLIDSVGHEANLQEAGPCLITSFELPTDIPECGAGHVLEVHLSRWPSDHLDSVVVMLVDTSRLVVGTQRLSPFQSDSVWRASLDPRLFRCVGILDSVHYELTAWTRFGLSCSAVTGNVQYRNQRPSLSRSTLPDTLYRPVSGADTIVTTVDFSDCELQGDSLYYGVRFSVRWWDVEQWSEDPSYFLRDDGVEPDSLTGDGVFTVGLEITPSDTRRDDLLHFRFFAVDCAAPYDSSAFLYDSVQVIQRTGALVVPPSRGNDFGIRVIR